MNLFTGNLKQVRPTPTDEKAKLKVCLKLKIRIVALEIKSLEETRLPHFPTSRRESVKKISFQLSSVRISLRSKAGRQHGNDKRARPASSTQPRID